MKAEKLIVIEEPKLHLVEQKPEPKPMQNLDVLWVNLGAFQPKPLRPR